MEHKLYEAAMEGSVRSLHELLGEDPLVLHSVTVINCFNRTPLHVAAMLGHVDFVKEIVARNPELAGELDSRGLSPLHWASAKGHLEIVKALVLANPEMCHARDRLGRNPLHLAAIKGQVSVLKELLQARLDAARATLPDQQGATILHLCVQHNRLEALKLLLETMNDDEFASSKDDHHNTILDLAVDDKQIETIKYLVDSSSARIDVNAINANRLDNVLAHSRPKSEEAGALGSLGGTTLSSLVGSSGNINESGTSIRQRPPPPFLRCLGGRLDNRPPDKFMKEMRSGLMVVASVILTLTFQIGVNPPGGVWQDDLLLAQAKPGQKPHKAGEVIMGYTHPNKYAFILYANVMSFTTSMMAMLFLLIPIPLKTEFFVMPLFGLMLSTCITVMATYGFSIVAISPDPLKEPQFQEKSRTDVLIAVALVSALLIPAALVYALQYLGMTNIWQQQTPSTTSVGDINHALLANTDQEDRQQIHSLP